MKVLSLPELQARSVELLGLDSTAIDLTSPEAIAALIRRTAAFNCPCTVGKIVSPVVKALSVIKDTGLEIDEMTQEIFEALIAYGDFVESTDITGTTKDRMIYLAPPAFVAVSSSMFLLLGVATDGYFPLSATLSGQVEYVNHSRRLKVSDAPSTTEVLKQSGLISVRPNVWLKAPSPVPAAAHLARYESLLEDCGPVGAIDDLLILDSQLPVTYYRGRWRPLKKQSGIYIARRPQPYGAPLWCLVKLDEGRIKKLLDFPAIEQRWRPCDEAWHLQAAVDRIRGIPQLVRCRNGPAPDLMIVDFFSPVPLWARRRWDCVGTPVLPNRCLFSYSFHRDQLAPELIFAHENVWLEES